MNIEKVLELGKLEFNIFHSIQVEELKCVSRWWALSLNIIFIVKLGLSEQESKINDICMCRWWKESGFPELNFIRHRHVEFYTLGSGFATEPKHSAFRLSFIKMCHLITILDDIYDTFGKLDELKVFTAAIKRWGWSIIWILRNIFGNVFSRTKLTRFTKIPTWSKFWFVYIMIYDQMGSIGDRKPSRIYERGVHVALWNCKWNGARGREITRPRHAQLCSTSCMDNNK